MKEIELTDIEAGIIESSLNAYWNDAGNHVWEGHASKRSYRQVLALRYGISYRESTTVPINGLIVILLICLVMVVILTAK